MTTYSFKMVKESDKKGSVKFKPASADDEKECTALYLMRPRSDGLTRIKVTIEDELESL